MKDVILYVFLFALYAVLGLRFAPAGDATADVLSWELLGRYLLIFFMAGALARWTVLAFKKRPPGLISGQKIVGIEEPEAEQLMDVLKPEKVKKELKKPKLRKRRFL